MRNVVEAVAAACGKHHYIFHIQQLQLQQQHAQQLCPTPSRGSSTGFTSDKHLMWMFGQSCGLEMQQTWKASSAEHLQLALAKTWKSLSTLQHYVRIRTKLLLAFCP